MKGKLFFEENIWYVEKTPITGEGQNLKPNYEIHPEFVKYYFLSAEDSGQPVEFEISRFCPFHKSDPSKNSLCTFDCSFDEILYAKLLIENKNLDMNYIYDIRSFYWNEGKKTFFADAWDLEATSNGSNFYDEAFPSQKNSFEIQNYKTGGSRNFEFSNESKISYEGYPVDEGSGEKINFGETVWNFVSQDGLKVCITVIRD
jgi:hypothetical protein